MELQPAVMQEHYTGAVSHLHVDIDEMIINQQPSKESMPSGEKSGNHGLQTPVSVTTPTSTQLRQSNEESHGGSDAGTVIKTGHIFRIEYIDVLGNLVAVRKGATPPELRLDQGIDNPIFELIKRVIVFPKEEEPEDRKEGSSTQKNTEDQGTKHTSKSGTVDRNLDSRAQGSEEKKRKIEDDRHHGINEDKLKSFEVSPETDATWSLKIRSEYLMNALRAVVGFYPGLQLLSSTITFDEPYKELFHHMDQLEYYKDNQEETHPHEYRVTCKDHIEELLGFLTDRFGAELEEERARHQREVPVCTFKNLWLLFKPGEEIYVTAPDSNPTYHYPGIVDGIRLGPSIGNSQTKLVEIKGWGLDTDGIVVSRSRHTSYIQPFEGEKPISELKCYPTRFHRKDPKDSDETPLSAQMEKWGEAWFNVCQSKGHYKMLRGRPLDAGGKDQQNVRHVIKSRVIADFTQYYLEENAHYERPIFLAPTQNNFNDEDEVSSNGGCCCSNCHGVQRVQKSPAWKSFHNIDPDKPLTVENKDLFYRLCDMRVFVYVLKDREWFMVHIRDLYDVSFNESLLDSLVLPDEIKNTVKALAWDSLQRREDRFEADFIEGKGNGQIILLHGAPGVGKTATAECVAELMQRPLISLTCGDLGTDVATVETNLKKFLSWGDVWNAVVLLDEADVYLESREKGEVKRNALVSVFLRELERYEGIMFLTTNRVGSFDDAFLSRIHVGLLFKTLTESDREKVWNNHFDRLESESRDPAITIHPDAKAYVIGAWKRNGMIQDDLVNIKWNGREIRNAFQTALALASYATNGNKKKGQKLKDVMLRAEHIQNVVGMSNQFKDFINKTKKSDEEGRARAAMVRASSDGEFVRESSFVQGTPTRMR